RGLGGWLPRPAGDPLARPYQTRHREEPTVRSAGLGPHVRRYRGRPFGRRTEEANRGRTVSRHRQDDARRLRPARLSRRQAGKGGARSLLLLLGRDAIGGAVQELEDVLHHVATRASWLDYAARAVPLHPGPEHQA